MQKAVSSTIAHIMGVFTVIMWGTSFIASKVLLDVYSPIQVMLLRFILAYIALWLIRPKPLIVRLRDELGFAALGIFGCTVYFLCENSALTYTYAANVSIIVAAAPILTAILAHFFVKGEKLSRNIFLGFFIAIVGVALVVFNGTVILKLDPIGDLLSLCAAICWAVYSVMLRRNVEKYDSILLTRRIMLWGMLTALPMALVEGHPFSLAPLADVKMLFCILFLGLVCSGLCYIFWNLATRRLGTVVLNNYIYVVPFFTMLAGAIVLKEPVSVMGAVGAVLILLGVFIADRKKQADSARATMESEA